MLGSKKKSLKSESVAWVRVVSPSNSNPEIKLLTIHVSRLIEMMTLLTARTTVPPNDEVSESKKSSNFTVAQVEKPVNQGVCFNCGGVGHYRRVCPVISEAQRPKQAGKFRGPSEGAPGAHLQ